jgi:putative transposase
MLMAECFIQVTAGVIVRDGRVLVCQRAPGGHHPGKWEFPGGKVEPGESLEECLRRELREELGIDATIGALRWTTRHQYPGRDPFVLSFFLVARYTGTLENRIFADVRWTSVDALGGFDFLEGDREFVAALAAGSVRLAPGPSTHRRRSVRLQDYDYSQAGAYFVTICTQNRECLFGDVVGDPACMCPNDAGRMIVAEWCALPDRFTYVQLDESAVMPNHIHTILFLNPTPQGRGESCIRPDAATAPGGKGDHKDRAYGTVGRVVQAFKSSTTRAYSAGVVRGRWPPFAGKLWQRNYHEHIIRNEASLDAIRQYIVENPARWAEDEENPINRHRKQ